MTRLEEIRNGGATLALHINFGDGYGYAYRCIRERRIILKHGGPKGRKSKREHYRFFVVEGVEGEFATLEEAVLAVERLDQGVRDDAEWSAAAPKRKRPPLLLEGP